MKCQYCEKSVDLPFRCPFCGWYFCGDHRLPENHACPELTRARARQPPAVERHYQPAVEGEPEQLERELPLGYPLRFRRARWTSATEMLHLTLGALMVMAVGLSWESEGLDWMFQLFWSPMMLLSSALVFTLIFVLHELAHKAAAKQYGLWAEFRLTLMGALLTLISVAPTPIKFVSPGAVMITGAGDKRTVGKTALAGPLTSIALSCALFALYLLIPRSYLALVALRGASLSAWLALLNLIPFGILDGSKVIWWNKPVWIVSFAASVTLMLVTAGYSLVA